MATDEQAGPSDAADSADHQEGELWARWHGHRDHVARDALARLHLPFARILAAQLYARRTHDEIAFDEYFQMACVGLMESIDRYDPAQGARFRTFAGLRIRGSVLNGLPALTEKQRQIEVRQQLRRDRLASLAHSDPAAVPAGSETGDPTRRSESLFRQLAEVGIGLALSVLLEDGGILGAAEQVGPETYFRSAELAQLRQRLRDTMHRLAPRHREILVLHYEKDVPFVEIATLLGVTKGRVSQLHREALGQLRESLSAGGLTHRDF